MFATISMKSKIFALSSLIVFILFVLLGVSLWQMQNVYRREKNSIALAETAKTALIEMEYLLDEINNTMIASMDNEVPAANDSSNRMQELSASIDARFKTIEQSFTALSQITDTNGFTDFKPKKTAADIKERLNGIQTAAGTFETNTSETGNATGSGRIAGTQQVLETTEKIAASKKELRTAGNGIKEIENKIQSAADNKVRKSLIAFSASGVGLSLALLALSYRFARSFSNTLKKRVKESRDLISGVTDKKLLITEKNELTELLTVIQDAALKVKEGETTLEEKVKARTDELEKIKNDLEKTVAEQSSQYAERIKELETLNKAMIGRELKMAHLKQDIEKLKEQIAVATGKTTQ